METTNTIIKVVLFNHTVGYLSWNEKRKRATFEYEQKFLDLCIDIAPLTMPIKSVRSQNGMPWEGIDDRLYQGLPAVFADSLPDKWGTSLFNHWLTKNKLSKKTVSPLDHLAFIGKRAIGALEYEPAVDLGKSTSTNIDIQQLYEFAKQILDERETTILDNENSILWQDLIRVGTSAGGKRPKAIVAINRLTGQTMSGQGLIPEGFSHYILKYDDNKGFPYAKMEYVYYLMASDAGIKMMPSSLKQYGDISHFITERFDRKGNTKIHSQTLAAIKPFSDSYEDAFSAMRELNCSYPDFEQLYRIMVFNILGGNVDDHNKNISFLMDDYGKWSLAPAYDITYCLESNSFKLYNRHELTIQGKAYDITSNDLLAIGEKNDIRNCSQIIQEIKETVSNIDLYAKRVDIPPAILRTIKKTINLQFPK